MKRVLVFDVDDTLVIHTNQNNDLYNMNNDNELQKLINETQHENIYIYTNGTYSHGEKICDNLKLNEIVDQIFARDNISHMKPYYESFNYVNYVILQKNKDIEEIVFFDDMLENLKIAKKYFGWTTVWISPNFNNKPHYVDYSFANIYDALVNL